MDAKSVALILIVALGSLAAPALAQPGVIVTGPAPPCVEVRGQAQAGPMRARFRGRLPCPPPPPPPPPPLMVPVPPSGQVVVALPPPAPVPLPPPPAPEAPQPPSGGRHHGLPLGSFQFGYTGALALDTVVHGGQLRMTADVVDHLLALELTLGARGGVFRGRMQVIEFPAQLGLRLSVPLVASILRLYGSLTTGVQYRGLWRPGERGSGREVVSWSSELGGGVELGGRVNDELSVGGHLDVRLRADVPDRLFEPGFGVVWSGGLALFWM